MSRTLTTYKRPSIAVLLATTGTIESLAAMRVEMLRALATGEIAPSEKTVREWHEAIWVRVIELIALPHRRGPATEARSCYRMLDESGAFPIAAANRNEAAEGNLQP